MIITILFGIFTLATSMSQEPIYDFKKDSKLDNWKIVNDGVMGGLSQSNITINEEGHGLFLGDISLDNYGGFASVRYDTGNLKVSSGTRIQLRIKGDGKKYQFRIKNKKNDYHSYITYFETSGEWETIEIILNDLKPSFRGRMLDMPNFDHELISELSILYGNKKTESFKILIDQISHTNKIAGSN